MKPGDLVEDFTLLDQDGNPRSLTGLLEGGPVVLFFYPQALTAGCTRESCHFRDLGAEFDGVGAVRVGISMDKVDKQAEFSAKHGFDYPLLSDPDGEVAAIFGVKRMFDFLRTKRATFIISTDRRVKRIINSETSMSKHADEALDYLKTIGV